MIDVYQLAMQGVHAMAEDKETRNVPLGLRVFPSLKEALEKAAKDDVRTTASMAEFILTSWLRDKGYLK
jgi:hypothetical protein